MRRNSGDDDDDVATWAESDMDSNPVGGKKEQSKRLLLHPT
jgi:hypothetical protein